MTGRVDHDLLDRLAAGLARSWAGYDPGRASCTGSSHPGCAGPHGHGDAGQRPAGAGDAGRCRGTRSSGGCSGRTCPGQPPARSSCARPSPCCPGPAASRRGCGPGTLPRPAGSVSLPLDVGTVTDLVPPHLRRAIITRDRHCAAPGCDIPPAACHVHHIVPRSQGGTTSLGNCLLLCSFHHLILIHRWGWTITLNADGTTTAKSPDGRVLHSHSPPLVA